MRSIHCIAGILLLLSVAGCSMSQKGPKYAVIQDRTHPGFRVVAVDGETEIRAGGKTVATVVPNVLVEPGTHTITVKPDDEETSAEITAMFEAEKDYHIDRDEDGSLILVESVR